MSAEENIQIEKRIIDALNHGQLDILDEVRGATYVFHGPDNPD